MNIFLIISGVFLVLLGLGFLLGFFRGWCKSLIRLGIVVAIFLTALFVTPIISDLFDSFIRSDGTKIILFGTEIDILVYIKDYVGTDLNSVIETTTILVSSVVKIILNFVTFILIFIVLEIISLIAYWIISFIVGSAIKEDKEREIQELNEQNSSKKLEVSESGETQTEAQGATYTQINISKEPKGKNIWLRLLGGLEGMVGAVVLCLVILVPIFGIMNTLDKTLEKQPSSNEAVASAAHVGINNFICGELYYTEDKNIGKIESLIEKYDVLRNDYKKSPVGFMLKYTGIEKLGTVSFNYLTTVKVDDSNMKISSELASIIDTYSLYKKVFIKEKFDIKKPDTISNIKLLYTKAKESTFVKMYIEDIIPNIANKWANNEKFIGIDNPIPEKYQSVANGLLNTFAATKSFNNIDNNLMALFTIAERASEQGLIVSIAEGKDIILVLSENNQIVKDSIIALYSTFELRNNTIDTLNNALVLVYDLIVGDGKLAYTPSENTPKISDVNAEAQRLQDITNEILSLYKKLDNVNAENTEELIDELGQIGKIIDLSRNSESLSNTLQKFIVNFINSNLIKLGEDANKIKTTLVSYIDEKWSVEENPDFSFETTFKTVGETVKVANNILNKAEDITIKDLSSVIEIVVNNENVKEVLSDVIKDEIIVDLVGDSETAEVMTDILDTFIENTTAETLEKDLEAAQSVIDVISKGNNKEFNETVSNEIIESIGSSDAIMSMIDSVTSDSSKTGLQDLVSEVSQENKDMLTNSIENSKTLTS